MKKFISNISAILISAMMFTGCMDLSETLNSGNTAQDYYKTVTGMEDLGMSMYYAIQVKYGDYNNIWDHGTDIWTYGSGAREFLNSYEPGLNPTATARNWYAIWNAYYEGINLANSVIGRVDDVEEMSDDRKIVLTAEARFLRALYYHHLVQTHGDVHLTVEETQGVETEANRTPENEIWEVVIEDLKYAAENLPAKGAQVGRATSGAAKHLLARVYLITEDWAGAAEMADEVINSNNYNLIDSYYTLWDPYQSHSGVSYNEETIFGLLITPNSGMKNRDIKSRRFSARTRTLPGLQSTFFIGNEVSRHRPTEFLVTEVFNNDPDRNDVPSIWNDERWKTGFQEAWIYNDPSGLPAGKAIGDTALYFPVSKVFQEMTDAEKEAYEEEHGYRVFRIQDWETELWPSLALKFRRVGDESPEWALANFDNYDIEHCWRTEPIFRLGETYLIAAEAYMMMGENSKGADYFNAIRKRAEAPDHIMPLITPGELNIDEILNERHRELTGEYLTWYDLKRTGKLLERVRAHNPEAAPHIQEYHLLRPIPQEQIDRCTNDYPQNPGY